MGNRIKRLNTYIRTFGLSYLIKRALIKLHLLHLSREELNFRYWLASKYPGKINMLRPEKDLNEEDGITFIAKDGSLLFPDYKEKVKKAFAENPNIKLVYTDEDCYDEKTDIHSQPFFKPDYSPEFQKSYDYIGPVYAVRSGFKNTALIEFREEEVMHIPEVLFSKAFPLRGRTTSSGRRLCADRSESGPLLSILIPNKDHIEDLKKCIDSLLDPARNTYRNFEIIVIENNSEKEETFEFYDSIRTAEDKAPSDSVTDDKAKLHPTVRTVTYTGSFNYSKINNFGAKEAKGELLLLLNNDTEIIEKDSIAHLVNDVCIPGISAAGAKLYYEDKSIQHAGIVIGINGFAANMLPFISDEENYFPYAQVRREMSACTAACLMIRRDTFEKIKGFDEDLAVALNDVDLCMKVRALGEKIIFDPNAKLFHYESKSRGLDMTGESRARFEKEIAYFKNKWSEELEKPDPYYNRSLSLTLQDYSLDPLR